MTCRHPLCALVGDGCSLDAGVSRGCRTGPRPWREVPPEVIDELRARLAELAVAPPAEARAVAARLARLIRQAARAEHNLLALARDDELEPDLRAQFAALVVRR